MTRLRCLLLALVAAVGACSSPEQVTQEHAAPVTYMSIDVPSLALGDEVVVAAMLTIDGVSRSLASDEFSVTSSDPSVVEVTATRRLIAHREGTAVITAALLSDPHISFGRTMHVAAPIYASLEIMAPSGGVVPGDSIAIALVGRTASGAAIISPKGATLASRSAAVGTIEGGLFVAHGVGATWLVGNLPGNVVDSLRLAVAIGSPTSLTITPEAATVGVGDTLRLTTRLADRRNNTVVATPQFSSSAAAIATVDAAGVVVARGAGAVLVIASHGLLADTLVAVVNGGSQVAPPPASPDPVVPPPPVTGPISVTPPGALVQVRIAGTPSAPVIAAFTSAAAKLNAMLRSQGTAYDVTLTAPAGLCASGQPAINEVVPGLLITAVVGPIDGPSNILGYAGPCLVRQGTRGLPALGTMTFDEADMQLMAANNILNGVVLHEMLHVLGIGTLWGPGYQGFVAAPSGTNPRFTGALAVAEYGFLDALDAATGVPVENTGGPGTRGGHWRESVFQTELMTGWAGGAMAMSRMTAAALADMGYDIDISRADPYALPSGMAGISERGVEIADRILLPIGKVDRHGIVP